MKHNPKINERVAALPGLRRPAPAAGRRGGAGHARGAVAPRRASCRDRGLPHVTLQPAAGAQGELCGLLLMRAYHESRGDAAPHGGHPRHGARHEPGVGDDGRLRRRSRCKTDARGGVDLDDLRAKVDENVAGLMLDEPLHAGLFDENIAEIAQIFHDVGALLYYDGANLNAVMGVSRPGDMGFDIVHFNTAQVVLDAARRRRAGRRPGRGDRRARAVPADARAARGATTATLRLEGDRPDSIGKLKSYVGNFGVLVRAYTYIRSHGADGIRGRRRDRRAERELPAGPAQGRLRAAVRPARASTSSCSRRAG